ncbi:hypothetical protein ACW95P_02865 [Candidatus Mycoplasma pogonae]
MHERQFNYQQIIKKFKGIKVLTILIVVLWFLFPVFLGLMIHSLIQSEGERLYGSTLVFLVIFIIWVILITASYIARLVIQILFLVNINKLKVYEHENKELYVILEKLESIFIISFLIPFGQLYAIITQSKNIERIRFMTQENLQHF